MREVAAADGVHRRRHPTSPTTRPTKPTETFAAASVSLRGTVRAGRPDRASDHGRTEHHIADADGAVSLVRRHSYVITEAHAQRVDHARSDWARPDRGGRFAPEAAGRAAAHSPTARRRLTTLRLAQERPRQDPAPGRSGTPSANGLCARGAPESSERRRRTLAGFGMVVAELPAGMTPRPTIRHRPKRLLRHS